MSRFPRDVEGADSLLDLLGDRDEANHSVFALGHRDRSKPAAA